MFGASNALVMKRKGRWGSLSKTNEILSKILSDIHTGRNLDCETSDFLRRSSWGTNGGGDLYP
jgi:hypothetical protein